MNLPTQRQTAMVLGANGRIGRAAVEAFAGAGWNVVAQARRAPAKPWPTGVQPLIADALDLPALSAAGRGADVIMHALSPDYTRWSELLPPLTRTVIELAAATGATLMLPGNVYNFGSRLPECLDERTPFVGGTSKARMRIELEAALQAATARGVRSIVIRAGDFLGGAGSWFDLGFGRALSGGKFTHLGPRDLVHAWAYLPDLAEVFVRVAERRADLGAFEMFHYEGLTLTSAQLQAASEQAVGRRLKAAAFPWWLMRTLAPLVAMPRALVEMRYLWQRPHRLDESKLRALIGPVPHTALDRVMRECVAALPGVPPRRDAAGDADAGMRLSR